MSRCWRELLAVPFFAMALGMPSAQATTNASLRTQYVRTNALWDYAYLNYSPQPWILYEPGTKRFFASNSTLNRVDVLDAATESKVGEITVPGAWSGDVTPDHTTIYMGTQIGDIYVINPVTMTVTKRIPSSKIGMNGFTAWGVHVLADGRLALVGFPGGRNGGGPFAVIHGYGGFAIWNSADNSLNQYAGPVNSAISEVTLTADRTKVVLASINSDNTLAVFDPATGSEITTQAFELSIGVSSILVSPDGKEILIPYGPGVTVYDATTLKQLDRFVVGDGQRGYSYVLSSDGNTLFAVDRITATALAVDWRSHSQKGWVANFSMFDLIDGVTPMAVDETGLIAGVIGHGVAFLDGANLLPAKPAVGMYVCCYPLQPAFGPVQGGTQVQEPGVAPTLSLAAIYFGDKPASAVSVAGQNWYATTPAGHPGPVNVRLAMTDGGTGLLPDAYSYGPWILEVARDTTTAEGGATGRLYGYGFGAPTAGGTAPDLRITIGSQQVTITKYSGLALPVPGLYPFPLEMVEFTLPPEGPGTATDLTIANAAGMLTLANSIKYLPALQQYALPGSALAQGIYDAKRDLYYFTDQTQLRIFSRTRGSWQTPVVVAHAVRLWGLALSPNGSQLAISDAGTNIIYVLNPDCLLYTSPSPRDLSTSRMPSSA